MFAKNSLTAQPLTWIVRRFMSTRSARNVAELLNRATASNSLNTSMEPSPEQEQSTLDPGWTTRPWYPATKDEKRCQARRGESVNPEGTSVVLFPGEAGPVASGSARFLEPPKSTKGREMLAAASDMLNEDLEAEFLKKSGSISQAAILVHSLIAAEEMPDAETCVACAGFGLGELTALTFAGSIDFVTAVRLAAVREEALKQIAAETSSGLMAVVYGPDSKLGAACLVAQKVAEKLGRVKPWCGVAAYLYPHCKIVGGHDEALSFLEKNGGDFKLRACRRLPAAGAYYTPIMGPVVPILEEALAEIDIKPPRISVYSCCRKGRAGSAKYATEQHVRRKLAVQLATPIQWEQTLHSVFERKRGMEFPQTYVCGPGGRELGEVVRLVNAKAAEKMRALS